MRTLLNAALLGAVALPLAACNNYDNPLASPGYAPVSRGEARAARREARDDTVVYRGQDGQYYCKREDGSTGTFVGAGIGAVLGNIIAPGGSRLLGTLLGGAGGAVAGRAIDRSDFACE